MLRSHLRYWIKIATVKSVSWYRLLLEKLEVLKVRSLNLKFVIILYWRGLLLQIGLFHWKYSLMSYILQRRYLLSNARHLVVVGGFLIDDSTVDVDVNISIFINFGCSTLESVLESTVAGISYLWYWPTRWSYAD